MMGNRLKKLLVAMLIVVLMIPLAACGSSEKKDLKRYMKTVDKVMRLEEEATEALSGLMGRLQENDSADTELLSELENTVLLKYEEFRFELKSIKPKTKQLRELHKRYVSVVETRLDALDVLRNAIEYSDWALFMATAEAMDDSEAKIRAISREFRDLKRKYNLE